MSVFFDALGQLMHGMVEHFTGYETTSVYSSRVIEKAIEILDNVPGMTPCRTSLFKHSSLKFSLRDGSQIRTWQNGGFHVFLADKHGKMIYGGFVWLHKIELQKAIISIKKTLT